jgi:hypothetical protein
MTDTGIPDTIDPSDVQRIRDSLAELRRLDEEVIAAWRELQKLEREPEGVDRSKDRSTRWYNAPELGDRLKRFENRTSAWNVYLLMAAGVAFALWLGFTDGPSVVDRSSHGEVAGSAEQLRDPASPGVRP